MFFLEEVDWEVYLYIDGRQPMTKELRNKKLSLCFTDAEYEEIRARAELMGIPVARLA